MSPSPTKFRLRPILTALLVVLLGAAGGCDGCNSTASEADDGKPLVVTTTTMLDDLSEQLGGDAVRVEGIMAPGGDPHIYQPTPSDARLIAKSDLVVTSGLKLEGWINDLVRNAGGERPVIVASDGVDPIKEAGTEEGVDPHFWFDLQSWDIAVDNVGQGLVELVGKNSPAADAIRQRQKAYKAQNDRLHDWIYARMETIPEKQRVLITSHDAFAYFGRTYGIDVVGIQGISTDQEASQRDVANIVDVVDERDAPAVFVETSVNPALIKQVARETGVEVAGPLYSDSIGAEGTPAGTFVGTVIENVRMITEALGGQYEPFEPKE
jgi:ABC-type Zn uptake system ZnuABC Zn-binding protein ZnuA